MAKEPTNQQRETLGDYNEKRAHVVRCEWKGNDIRVEYYSRSLTPGFVGHKKTVLIDKHGGKRSPEPLP